MKQLTELFKTEKVSRASKDFIEFQNGMELINIDNITVSLGMIGSCQIEFIELDELEMKELKTLIQIEINKEY